MSAATSFLQKQLKTKLVEWAHITDLQDYEGFNKNDLVTALDSHLQAHQSIFIDDARLRDYYRRLSGESQFLSPAKNPSPAKASPSKRGHKVEASPSPDEAPRSTRKRGTRSNREVEQTDDSDLPQTPSQVLVSVQRPLSPLGATLPPSPAVVTDVIDRQTAAWGKSLKEIWRACRVQEQSESLRSNLSSVKAIGVVLYGIESFSVLRLLFPLRPLTRIPAVDALHLPTFKIWAPDAFVLVESSFWTAFIGWLFTSLIIPLTLAYFFNISLQVAQTGGPASNTRRAARQLASFDPLSFHIAKAIFTYLVYSGKFSYWGFFNDAAIEDVNDAIPGHWPGLITGSAIGVITTLYEAILRK
ncbi:uncharacterized protein BP01DRAFT_371027 [Aspergillus saccharolyticus JOP 1030-1]|uniref:Uncharacterized protein n=1 Tax=Aspergillus saccharolyticus JOP 1030-1 TaxID=1450539 RepID=A0A318ZMD1_9EURO|nr:hypothetical protein BP01DRAFT_371027 [Aspergillus saccharolyticus JOP 1030-1]PYH48781.1 hypothetical protein BP01DRAFT_371027 [Aspergillus saccharolyticus JOP 1030-1]